ncbi:hypothetical protein H2201_000268 [Coniosporium apollinis]|uniref:Uncharacterized protein n=1 Tax=Coniosporium apollinis TaxID=61459 RepID=A0ABQ9P5Y6_9PEZI|nr:hypothetical protein H2201_000268 [Coniosporium apollinis]
MPSIDTNIEAQRSNSASISPVTPVSPVNSGGSSESPREVYAVYKMQATKLSTGRELPAVYIKFERKPKMVMPEPPNE